ncbi:MAG: hypothetical protein IH596_11950 [Bacteroidales bacterium]|nr:hypothetical protein [Bacteroidales bacterium]
MKTREILTILFVAVLIISGCREISVTTQVHRDGSFTRIIRITGDSSSVFKEDLPYPIDSTWQKLASKDTNRSAKNDDAYILTYTKTFRNSEELMAKISQDTSWRKHLQCQVTVTNRFGFFYSYLTFNEVFQPANPFTCLPYQDYLTSDDLLWLTGQKTAISHSDSSRFEEVEKKTENFIVSSVTAEMEQILKDGIVRLNDPALMPAEVENLHDSILRYVGEWEFDQPENFINYLIKWTGNPVFDQLNELNPPLFVEFNKKVALFNNLIMMDTYPETVEMPGLIIETNSPMLKGNQVSWEVEPMNLMFQPFQMVVESRVVNNWAFAVSGIILILLIVVFVVKAFRK